jgi:uncharacterized protein YacL
MKINKTIHVKIISVFYTSTAILFTFFGFTYLVASNWLKANFIENTYLQNMDSKEFVLWGIILFLIAIIEFYFAYKLFKDSKPAKKIAIVISIIGIIWAIFGLFVYKGLENIFFLFIHGYFIWALKHK